MKQLWWNNIRVLDKINCQSEITKSEKYFKHLKLFVRYPNTELKELKFETRGKKSNLINSLFHLDCYWK